MYIASWQRTRKHNDNEMTARNQVVDDQHVRFNNEAVKLFENGNYQRMPTHLSAVLSRVYLLKSTA